MVLKRTYASLLAALLLLVSNAAGQFWYGVDGPVALVIDSLKVTIKFDTDISPDDVLQGIDRVVEIVPDNYLIDGFLACSLSTGSNYGAFLDSLGSLTGVYLAEPYYLSENGYPMLVGEKFCVAFNEDVTQEESDSINTIYNVVIDRQRIGRPYAFVLKNTDSTGIRVVELANMYYNLPETRYAHPNFSAVIERDSYVLYDYYNEYQPHTKKVIGDFNTASVWDFAGLTETVTVAVIDAGVEAHEDLPASRLLPGYDFGDHDADPKPYKWDPHGTACAGIIAASHTTDSSEGMLPSSGVISMNPNVNILPVKIFRDGGSSPEDAEIIDAIDYARNQGADILANSWNYSYPYHADIPDLNEALMLAMQSGRDGKGCPVIFSAGNTGLEAPGVVKYPARLPYCFSVGGIRLDDIRWDFSSYGEDLDIVAPTDDAYTVPVWGLDLMGSWGQNPKFVSSCPPGNNDVDYWCVFGRTSAASPVVSGTVALILARDDTLTSEVIYDVLRNSAVKNLDWGSLPDTPHVEYGYGRVDAFRAILSISHGNVDNIIGIGGPIDVADITYLVKYLYRNGPEPFPSVLLADCDCDGDVTVADLTYLANYLFQGGPAPVKPCYAF